MTKDSEYLDKIEKAIVEKYGEKAIQNPKANWNVTKEINYLKQLQQIQKIKNQESKPEDNKIDIGGVLVPKKLFIKESNRVCISCSKYSFDTQDDLYMTKFRCCFDCYINHVEGREEKWLKQTTEKE